MKLQNQLGDKINILYLGYKDISIEEKVNELYKYQDRMENPWIFDHQGERVEDIIEYLISESNRIYRECTNKGLEYIEMYDINRQIDEVVNKLTNEE